MRSGCDTTTQRGEREEWCTGTEPTRRVPGVSGTLASPGGTTEKETPGVSRTLRLQGAYRESVVESRESGEQVESRESNETLGVGCTSASPEGEEQTGEHVARGRRQSAQTAGRTYGSRGA
eukprot:2603558-Amphidinium_carterae.1